MASETDRLHRIIESGKALEFFSTEDKEYKNILWTVFGAIETNEVIVRASVNGQHFYHAAPSQLLYPAMIDRRFGIDVVDNALARRLSNELWERDGQSMIKLIR